MIKIRPMVSFSNERVRLAVNLEAIVSLME